MGVDVFGRLVAALQYGEVITAADVPRLESGDHLKVLRADENLVRVHRPASSATAIVRQ